MFKKLDRDSYSRDNDIELNILLLYLFIFPKKDFIEYLKTVPDYYKEYTFKYLNLFFSKISKIITYLNIRLFNIVVHFY